MSDGHFIKTFGLVRYVKIVGFNRYTCERLDLMFEIRLCH